ncbi:MAG: methionine--tRNA ligase [Mariprofundaceae bacterium]
MQNYYVTTPIYYVNDEPHLGHIYTTIAADVLARFQRMIAKEVFFLTGVDEHGQKVQQAAEIRGIEPIELADKVVERYSKLCPQLSVSNDDFIRTTEDRHRKSVQKMWQMLDEAGAIYKGKYEDWYCVPCESFWTERQLKEAETIEGKLCPDCQRPIDRVEEESYFFRMDDYQERLLDHIHANPGFIAPESRRTEVIRFVESGLRPLSISRTTFEWGVPVPNDPKHVIYVWVDALTNYLTALGFPDGDKMRFWPASLHLIGKDILRFHAVYWPCMLMAVGLPLPERIFAHGWWTVEGEKMSKSRGNVLHPDELLSQFDADVIRYFLLREVPFGQDGDFSMQMLRQRYNTELANDLGNLLNRSLSMLHKYRDGYLPEPQAGEDADRALISDVEAMQMGVAEALNQQLFHIALEQINRVVRHGNRYVDFNAPWKLAKEGEDLRLDTVLYHLIETLRLISLQLLPFIPTKAGQMLAQIMNQNSGTVSMHDHGGWGYLKGGHVCNRPEPVFPRME